jgi:hypothetical protein
MQSRRGLQLDRVVLLGRTFEEYRRYFLLEPDRLVGKRVLDVAGGGSSFCAEANELRIKVTSFDPIYSLPPEKITLRWQVCDFSGCSAPLFANPAHGTLVIFHTPVRQRRGYEN